MTRMTGRLKAIVVAVCVLFSAAAAYTAVTTTDASANPCPNYRCR